VVTRRESTLPFLHQFAATRDWALLVLRIGAATPFLVHGVEKRKYWGMPPGSAGSRNMLRVYRFLSVAEPLGGLGILFGFLTSYAALGISLVMLGAIRTRIVVWHDNFGDDDGWEIDFILLATALTVMLLGPGRYSVDAALHLLA
jgi:putative oxidoreductase